MAVWADGKLKVPVRPLQGAVSFAAHEARQDRRSEEFGR
jgi:hypothetical protein